VFELHAKQHPDDWRAHATLGQARGLKGAAGAEESLRKAQAMAPQIPQVAIALANELRRGSSPQEAVALFQLATSLLPSDGSTYFALGETAAKALPRDCGDNDVVAHAWTHAIKLSPKLHKDKDMHRLLALHLSKCGPAQRPASIKSGQAAVRLAPTSAEAYDALGSALLTGVQPANLTDRARARAAKALRSAIKLRPQLSSGALPGSQGGEMPVGSLSSAETASAADTHYRLSRVLATSPSLQLDEEQTPDEEMTGVMSEAVAHVRAAARLDPAAYAESAAPFADWEEAVRKNRHAEHRSFVEREAMVKAMHAEVDGKRQEAEEDRAILDDQKSGELTSIRTEYEYEKKRQKGRNKDEV